MRPAFNALCALALTVFVALSPALAQGTYYANVDTSSAATLRVTLHTLIDDHTRFPYTASSTDTWNVLELAQQDPANAGRILDIYRNRSFVKVGGGNASYEREHVWPKSYGFPDDDGLNMPYTDCHMLWLCDGGYNGARSNIPFGACTASCAEYVTDSNNGQGGGAGVFPGQSNWTSGANTSGRYQVWSGRQGDAARALFYAAIRYEGGVHGVTGVMEPDLELTDNLGQIAAWNTGQNEAFGYMGRLDVLFAWHLSDPPDAFERRRNDVVAGFQGNRNPFIDHPEWVECVFVGVCPQPLGAVYCSPAVANSTGASADIEARGSAVVLDADFRLLASEMPTSVSGMFLCSRTTDIVFQPGGSQGNLCLGGAIGRAVGGQILQASVFGTFSTQVDLGALPLPTGFVPALAGETWNFQAWFRDVAFGAPTSNFTDAWQVTFQ